MYTHVHIFFKCEKFIHVYIFQKIFLWKRSCERENKFTNTDIRRMNNLLMYVYCILRLWYSPRCTEIYSSCLFYLFLFLFFTRFFNLKPNTVSCYLTQSVLKSISDTCITIREIIVALTSLHVPSILQVLKKRRVTDHAGEAQLKGG